MSVPERLRVAFVNENTLGHGSYLRPFVRELERRPELGIDPVVIDAVPLPPRLQAKADFTVRGLRRYGLDFNVSRWRLVVSRYVRAQLADLRSRERIDAVVVNTQSVGLELAGVAGELPLFACLDATFAQLADSAWFAPNRVSRMASPVTLAPILGKERKLFARAAALLGWSHAATASLARDYGVPTSKARRLPPSLELPPRRGERSRPERPRVLFLGGDFRRKGGQLLLDCFRAHFADRCELHLVTQSEVPEEAGVHVHRGVQAHTARWYDLWQSADVFVFPSSLETFGIVLLEALAFEVPVIASGTGAAAELLENGAAGWLLEEVTPETLRAALEEVLDQPGLALERAERGRRLVEAEYDLGRNSERLAEWLREAVRSVDRTP